MRVIKPIIYNTSSFERDSSATYLANSGLIETAGVDELRLGYEYDWTTDSLVPLGAIIEGGTTNSVLYSNTFENAAWELVGSPLPAVTDDSDVGPDGETSAALFEVGASVGTMVIRQYIPSWILMGKATFSVFVKALVPDTTIRLTMPDGWTSVYRINVGDFDAFEVYANITPFPDGWFRCEIYGSSSNPGYASIQAQSNDDFLMFGAMFEFVPFADQPRASSYFPSEGVFGVRAADIESNPPAVVSSNIPENDYPVYVPATAYNFEQVVMVTGDYHRNYRSRVAGTGTNTGNFPPDNPDKWTDMGATNRWRMFDMKVGADLQSSNAGEVDVTISLNEMVNSICLFNIAGSSVRVTMMQGSTVVYEREVDTITPPAEPGWWEYFFNQRRQIRDIALLDLPPASPTTVRVQVFSTTTAALGKLVIGYGFFAGFAEFGTTSKGITDYSTKEVDAFGNSFIQEKRYVGRMNVRTVVEPGQEQYIDDSLAELRATPAAYVVPTRNSPLILLGYSEDFDQLFATAANSYCTLKLQGI